MLQSELIEPPSHRRKSSEAKNLTFLLQPICHYPQLCTLSYARGGSTKKTAVCTALNSYRLHCCASTEWVNGSKPRRWETANFCLLQSWNPRKVCNKTWQNW